MFVAGVLVMKLVIKQIYTYLPAYIPPIYLSDEKITSLFFRLVAVEQIKKVVRQKQNPAKRKFQK